MDFVVSAIRLATLVFFLFVAAACKDPFTDTNNSTSNRSQTNPLEESKILFDWNQQSDTTICSALQANNNLLTIGLDFEPRKNDHNHKILTETETFLQENYANELIVIDQEARLGLLTVEIIDCSILGDIRALPQVQFVEPKYLAPIEEEDVFNSLVNSHSLNYQPRANEVKNPDINPGFYDPDTMNLSYDEYIEQVNGNAARIIRRHGIDRIHEEFNYYGKPNVGVAVIDNGILPNWVDYLSQGRGFFELEGYYRPYSTDDIAPDGPYPQSYDLYGITQSINSIYAHGTRQSERVYFMAPHINIKSVRASPFVFWFVPTQYQGVTESILTLAEDPTIRIISCSMGTVIHVHEIERAIDYFNAHDKIFIAAAGTSVPILKEVVRVVFPANLTTTISTTGLADTEQTGGEFVLGENAHGGLENDFTIDHASSSSESVSTSAGMFALLWSVNPTLTREQLIDILIQSSSEYQKRGRKDPVFGWGKVDMYQAFITVRETLK